MTATVNGRRGVAHRSALIAGVVGVALAALIALFAFSPKGETDDQNRGSPLEGKLAPALTGTDIDGQPFDLDRYRGQWVLVNYFATWCPPCVAEHPQLVSLSEGGVDPGPAGERRLRRHGRQREAVLLRTRWHLAGPGVGNRQGRARLRRREAARVLPDRPQREGGQEAHQRDHRARRSRTSSPRSRARDGRCRDRLADATASDSTGGGGS